MADQHSVLLGSFGSPSILEAAAAAAVAAAAAAAVTLDEDSDVSPVKSRFEGLAKLDQMLKTAQRQSLASNGMLEATLSENTTTTSSSISSPSVTSLRPTCLINTSQGRRRRRRRLSSSQSPEIGELGSPLETVSTESQLPDGARKNWLDCQSDQYTELKLAHEFGEEEQPLPILLLEVSSSFNNVLNTSAASTNPMECSGPVNAIIGMDPLLANSNSYPRFDDIESFGRKSLIDPSETVKSESGLTEVIATCPSDPSIVLGEVGDSDNEIRVTRSRSVSRRRRRQRVPKIQKRSNNVVSSEVGLESLSPSHLETGSRGTPPPLLSLAEEERDEEAEIIEGGLGASATPPKFWSNCHHHALPPAILKPGPISTEMSLSKLVNTDDTDIKNGFLRLTKDRPVSFGCV
ncbi:unnamed protein product [Protopolystoma xenopodis]|uniref:Uncharacterized protein n=1 Tax=Protopolystoma xenopodis TaxID=117903 RepID=A0A3S5BIP7_9PLAT|nr:unnamed protein product [Protopolystoma xenopodis]